MSDRPPLVVKHCHNCGHSMVPSDVTNLGLGPLRAFACEVCRCMGFEPEPVADYPAALTEAIARLEASKLRLDYASGLTRINGFERTRDMYFDFNNSAQAA